MSNKTDLSEINSCGVEDLAKLAVDMLHRTVVHHVFWFKEVEHQMGFERALEIMDTVYEKTKDIQIKRFSKLFGFAVKDGLPQYLLDMSREQMMDVIENIGLNWLAVDGVWFQEVEFKHGMLDAKRCGDSCWAWFSPFEAWSIKRLLDLPDDSGLEGLKKALPLRLYSRINRQSIIEDDKGGVIYQMNDCRVQNARKRKGLDDYPCKSAGIVEHTNFARTIDPRIKTECLACPPDDHPEDWFCAWRFYIPTEKG